VGAWLRAAPAIVLGISLVCLISFVFVPSVMALYQTRGSPPVSVDSNWLSLVALIANVVVFVLIVTTGRLGTGRER
jgi:uncharacterized protein with PQ loop repeat